MKKIMTSGQMKECDRFTMEEIGIPSAVLMERAALLVVEELEQKDWNTAKILAVCGTGNNGGDGAAAARILKCRGYEAEIFCLGKEEKRTEEMRHQLRIAENCGVPVVKNPCFREYTVIIDAIFGIGLSRPVAGTFAETIEKINASGVPVLAVDIPSGIHTDTGEVLGTAVRADTTVTFAFAKPGLLLYPGKENAGRVLVREMGILAGKGPDMLRYRAVEEKDLKKALMRDPKGNKGTFGKVLVAAGSSSMCGAALLCAGAVLFAGAGMVKVLTEKANRTPLFTALPEALADFWDEKKPICVEQLQKDIAFADVVVAGPGLSTSPRAKELLELILKETAKPLILDADALNLLSQDPSLWDSRKSDQILITPHAGELSRLLNKSIFEIKKDPVAAAREASERFDVCCVAKDAVTVICHFECSRENKKEEHAVEVFLNSFGTSALATAGSGDVLTGILGAFLAGTVCRKKGKLSPGEITETAALAVYAHGRAGEKAVQKANESSVTASMVIRALADVL